ncbi:hypothetical protein QBC33DRAFT_118190 [Phialemonium atrogriseum]|uniref:RGS domain-containing protein n=1 Tax=Phialemonium atrogriseum TaxID=1093897 RepID=A0AAJ0BXT2_9PEZI|nr:uncharacterized protein QBC33DRAFT_118190 [Phialemonium atrogriseum]KAK1765842.1 hypothetical protein QBC33DRAFT_118190 [Phialemonium atrogriseum]
MGSEFGITADTKAELRLNGVGIFWMTFGCVWTCLIIGGMAFLYGNRHTPLLRIRGLHLSMVAVTLLHLYWFIIQFLYTIGPLMPEEVEFWCMSTYLPFGIGLFQASNCQFLYVAKAQKRFLGTGGVAAARPKKDAATRKSVLDRFRRLDYPTKMTICVFAGLGFQLFLTIFMYLISRKFHSGWGIPGTEVHGTPMEQKVQQGRGWEWWPSIFWQCFWAWIIAPIILWQSRGIHDTLGWRAQTIGCCLAGLHATPMWLIAIYVPGMAPVNSYFLPPQWICLSIMMLEIFTIFIPCWQVMRHRSLRQETLESIAAWESKNKSVGQHADSLFTGTTKISKARSDWKSLSSVERSGSSQGSQYGGIFTMDALESVLERNPGPLREFSALRDFSGENIAFLTSVAKWKSSLHPSTRGGSSETAAAKEAKTAGTHDQTRREQFNGALRIYVDFISPRDAEFSINIASNDLKSLEAVFEKPARIMYGDKGAVNPVTPFDGFDFSSPPPSSSAADAKSLASSSSQGSSEKPPSIAEEIGDKVQYCGDIPDEFNGSVFDDAERSIKYLVLTNTWPKFVKERRYSLDSVDSQFTLESQTSSKTLSRAVRYLSSVKSTLSFRSG